MKIVHVITDLDTGGAELMLCKLLAGLNRAAFESEVVSLTDLGTVGSGIQALDIPVHALGMRRGIPNPVAVGRLASRLRRSRADIVQTWMYHADLLGGLAARWVGGIPVIWGIRNTSLDPRYTKRTTILTAKWCAWLSSRIPTRVVCCSEVSRRVHEQLGYCSGKMLVIPNGFDLTAFKPEPENRASVRKELGIPEDAIVIGLVARFDPLKDHLSFVQAAARLHARHPGVQFLLCGTQITWENSKLAGWIEAAGLRDRFHLLGNRSDIARLNAALDVATSSSLGEGFSNAIGEAMACGVPCVVTDVGDSAMIVGDTGKVVPPGRPEALAAAWLQMIEMGAEQRRQLGRAARRRVEEHFALSTTVAQYEKLYEEVGAYVRHHRVS